MPQSISEYLQIDRQEFESAGALNTILDRDTRLFIDPALARSSTVLANANTRISDHFRKVIKCLSESMTVGDPFWKAADKLLIFPEQRGTCLGYTSEGTAGRGMGTTIRQSVLATTKHVIDSGVQDPEILELIGFFEEGVGCDLVSDMVTKIVWPELIGYSRDVFNQFHLPRNLPTIEVQQESTVLALPKNPYSNGPIVLVPMEVLQDLPLAFSFEDIDWVCSQNQAVRSKINSLIAAHILSNRQRRLSKKEVRDLLLSDLTTLREIIRIYKGSTAPRYDFDEDRSGETQWYWSTKNLPYPRDLNLGNTPSIDQVMEVVLKICSQFQKLIEFNDLWRLLYNKDGSVKHESAAQLLFFGVADAYCNANNIDLNREPRVGRGSVDFKLSRGNLKITVEVKLSSNKKLVHGLTNQLPTYMESSDADFGIYLVLVVDKGNSIPAVRAAFANLPDTAKNSLELRIVNATPKDSASI
jgi:hypothetical protein